MAEEIQGIVVDELLVLLDPLTSTIESEESLKRFLATMGWNFDEDSGMSIGQLEQTVAQIATLAQTIGTLQENRGDGSLQNILSLFDATRSLYEKVNSLSDTFDRNLLVSEIHEIIRDIPLHLLVKYIDKKNALMAELFRWFEIIKIKYSPDTRIGTGEKIIRHPFAYEIADFENLTRFIKNPFNAFEEIYFTPFDRRTVSGAQAFTDKLFPRLGRLATAVGGISVYGIKPAYGVDFGSVGNEMARGALTVKWQTRLDQFGFGFTLMYSPQERGNLGWVIVPYGNLAMEASNGKFNFSIKSQLSVGGVIISDLGNVSFDTSDGLAEVNAAFDIVRLPAPDSTISYLIGEKEGTRLELGTISMGASFEAVPDRAGFDVHLDISKAKLVISGEGRDGFLQKILPVSGIEANFAFLLGYSSEKSLYMGANSGLELALAVHLDILGILQIQEIYLKIKPQDYGILTEGSITGGATLGPFKLSFEEIGIQSRIDWTKEQKNAGFADLSLGFKPPNGVGLSINAGAVTGGGYLFFDFEKEEYAGALELTIAGFISAKAIGLITTRMPDGSKGFSMLVIITAEFNPAFQLGYGFTLIGVGGLLGLNRTVLLDPLREGVRTGAVNNIMFPQNVIANAPRIISDLKAIFPPYEGRFLIGPMGKLGWGTPTLVSLSLGVIIEIPGNIAILGVLKIALPEERIPLVQIQVAFVGTIDFDKKLITFDASLYESFILTMPLEGDMAMRLKWGDNPDFILTVGGFHPSFTPPPLPLPTLRRLSISILNTDVSRIRVECYQAVTSNTVQFGAKAELFFGFSSIAVDGHIAFDALFQFSPFYFIIEVSASVSLKIFGMGVFSIRLRFSLEGPTPWRAKGSGSISFFFFDVSADFDITWGDSKNTALPDIQILPRFIEEIKKPEQWSTILASSSNLSVSLRKFEQVDGPLPLVLHPSGALEIRQKLLPLTVNIDKIGNQKTSDIRNVSISAASSNGIELKVDAVDEFFASAQYQNMNDADKLSKPSFVKMPGGVRLSLDGSNFKNGKMVRKVVEYEVTIIDKEPKKAPKGKFTRISGTIFTHFLKGNSVSRSPLSKGRLTQMQPKVRKLDVFEEGFTLAFQDNNKAFDLQSVFASESLAQTYMQQQIDKNPNLKKDVHVIPTFELQMS